MVQIKHGPGGMADEKKYLRRVENAAWCCARCGEYMIGNLEGRGGSWANNCNGRSWDREGRMEGEVILEWV
jgi:hypothetical protein